MSHSPKDDSDTLIEQRNNERLKYQEKIKLQNKKEDTDKFICPPIGTTVINIPSDGIYTINNLKIRLKKGNIIYCYDDKSIEIK